jgi:hypothetical protein
MLKIDQSRNNRGRNLGGAAFRGIPSSEYSQASARPHLDQVYPLDNLTRELCQESIARQMKTSFRTCCKLQLLDTFLRR